MLAPNNLGVGGSVFNQHINLNNMNHHPNINPTSNNHLLININDSSAINVRSRCGSLFDTDHFYKENHYDDTINVGGANSSLTKTPLYG